MSEDIYAKPDLTKKVRFQAAVKEDRNKDACEDVDDARIYDNYSAEESPPQDESQDKSQDKSQDESQDNTTEDQQKTASVNVSSGKKTRPGAAALFLGLLCLLFLVAVIVLVVVFIVEKNRLSSERDELQTSYIKMKSLNVNLTSERNELQTSNKEMKSLNVNLTSERNELQTSNSQMESERDRLNATNKNLTKERDEFKNLAEKPSCTCPWITFGYSCYLVSTSKKNWNDSRTFCQGDDADLVIISSRQEQTLFSSHNQKYWIGLTDEKSEGNWTWVDGTAATETYWREGQPDNFEEKEHCAQALGMTWNDLPCTDLLNFICEKMR